MTCAATSYNFINKTRTNSERLMTVIEQLENCFNTTPDQLEQCKTLFVTLDSELSSSLYYYDEKILSNTEAFKTFQKLTDLVKTEKEEKVKTFAQTKLKKPENFTRLSVMKKDKLISEKEKKIKQKTYKQRSTSYIHTVDMLYDKDDRSSIQCRECLKVFMTLSNLRNHFIRVHAPKVYKCTDCSRGFGSNALLEVHREESHVSLVCTECGKTFGNRHTLRMHERSHYVRFVCQDCGRVYKNSNTFKQHIINDICRSETRKSQADAKFTCDHCQKRYSQKMSLRVHIQHEHLNYSNIECEWCKKKFTCQSRLKAHIVKHTGERNFACTICDGKFVTKESLLYHTRTHTGERPYKCPHCDLRLLSASRRAAHIRSQHTDATQQCDLCSSKFRSHTYLQRHRKLHLDDRLAKQPRNKLQILANNAHKRNSRAKDFVLMPCDGKPVLVSKDLSSAAGDITYDATRSVQFECDASEGDSQMGNEEVYLEVSDGDDYVVKVSENVEV